MPAGGFFAWIDGRKSRVRRCTKCGTAWTMPLHSGNPRPRSKGIPIGELYAASRLLSSQSVARSQEGAEVREALAHCPQCGSGDFTESRERRTR